MELIINAENLVLGRLAGFVAKQALLGKNVEVINCGKAVVTGKKAQIMAHYKRKRSMGIPSKGPFFPRQEQMIVKRTIRGMLPYKQDKGRQAFERVKCYKACPAHIKAEKAITIKEALLHNNLKFLYVQEIARLIGGK